MAATYTVKQVAEILGYSTNSIYTFLKEKRLKGVRVGTGRFRIPQSELDRLLLITKRPQTSTPAVTVPASPALTQSVGVTDVTGGVSIERSKIFGFVHFGTLNVFDWFIGSAAIVSGLALFLFNPSMDKVSMVSPAMVGSVIRVVLIGGGIGILLTNILGQTHTIWHKLFHILVGALGLGLSVIMWRIGEFDGSLTYGGLGLLVLLSTFVRIGGVAWMCVYINMLTVSTIFTIVMAQQNVRMMYVIEHLPVSQFTLAALMIFITILHAVALWFGYKKNRQMFIMATWAAAIWYFAVAFWYSTDSYWSRSFFFLVVGMTSLFLGPWESLASLKSRKADMFTLGVFGGILVIILAGVTAVYLMQSNVFTTVEQENRNKVTYAKLALERTINEVKSTVVGAAADGAFAEAVVKNDLTTVNRMERVIFDSNDAIRRLVVLDRNGQGFNLYPFGTFDQSDLSGRDYFIQARDTGQPYISNLFEAKTDQSRRLVVSVAAPLYDSNREFAGVLVASLNLEAIGARLQKIAVPERGEYILVVDSNGKRIIHPDSNLIGSQIDQSDPVYTALRGGSGTFVGALYTGERAIVSYDQISGNGLHWAISIKSPTAKLYLLTEASNVSIFGVVIVAILIAGVILFGGFSYRMRRVGTGGSP